MGPTRMPVRGLTPILVLLAIAPPRVCACDHVHEFPPEPAPVTCAAGPSDDHPAHRGHDHDDPDCPCVKPAQLKAAILAASVEDPLPSPLSSTLAVLPDHGLTGERPASITRRTGDPPPLYLIHCTLRC